jgi:phage terminase large subunit
MELNIKSTPVFYKNYEQIKGDKRFIINVGGTRSSKTYSLCQLMVVYCLQNPNKIVSIVRSSFPSLRSSVMRDFLSVLRELDLYRENLHNKTEHIYTFPNGSMVEFFSVDDEQKLRGRKRDILWMNESNEISFDEFQQLNFRTSDKLFFDYNPSELDHWIDTLITRDDSVKIHSTYKDNPFLPKSIIDEIENLINVDEQYYRIYALGEQSIHRSTIFTHQKIFDEYPNGIKEYVYGLDFGFNHPTALVRVSKLDNQIYVEEIIYQSNLTSTDLVKSFQLLSIEKNIPIVCDYARPEIMTELRREGYYIISANKNVKEGIDSVKSSELYVHNNSINLQSELRKYKWKMIGDKFLDEPVKRDDDAIDAMRYGTLFLRKSYSKGVSTKFYTFDF